MSKKAASHASRVLVIDDDQELSDVIVDALRALDMNAWSIRPVPSGTIESIVKAAEMFKPGAILIDVVMPVNTAKLVKALRASKILSGTMLFGCSGHAILAGGFARHLDGFLHKPFSMNDLADMLLEVFEPSATKPAKTKKPGRKATRAATRR